MGSIPVERPKFMAKKYPICDPCKGKGEVPWSSRYAADANGRFSMAGEGIRMEKISVCGACHGTGMKGGVPKV